MHLNIHVYAADRKIDNIFWTKYRQGKGEILGEILAPITHLRTCARNKATFKGGHPMW